MRRTAALLMILVGLVLMASRLRAPGPGFLGVDMRDHRPPPGIYIMKVRPGYPAEKAGLLEKDVITEMDGRPIGRIEFARTIRETAPGTDIELTVMRGGRELRVVATLAERPPGLDFGPHDVIDPHDDEPDDPGFGGGERKR